MIFRTGAWLSNHCLRGYYFRMVVVEALPDSLPTKALDLALARTAFIHAAVSLAQLSIDNAERSITWN